jgi:hypothetical protein
MEQVKAGAKAAQRPFPANYHTACVTSACVPRPGDKLSDDRVINEAGSMVTCVLHFAWGVWKLMGEKKELIPPFFANVWGDYCKRVANYSLPETARFRQIHDGHCTFLQPEERRFVTPEAIRNTCIVGTPEEIISRLNELKRGGGEGSRAATASGLPAKGVSRFRRNGNARVPIKAYRKVTRGKPDSVASEEKNETTDISPNSPGESAIPDAGNISRKFVVVIHIRARNETDLIGRALVTPNRLRQCP